VTSVDSIVLAMGNAPLSDKLNLGHISSGLDNVKSPFTVNKYLMERGAQQLAVPRLSTVDSTVRPSL